MSIQAKIADQLKEAMRARETRKLTALRMLKSAIGNAAIEKRSELTESDEIAIVRREIKKRQDSVESFTAGNRPELAANEAAEIVILETFLPAKLDESEVEQIVRDAIEEVGVSAMAPADRRKAMGAVMKSVTAKAAGRVDGKTLSQKVQALLA